MDAWNLSGWAGLAAVGFAALVGLAVVVYLAAGLFQARSLVRREFTAYFVSPVAYAVLVVFLVVTGYLFSQTLAQLTAAGPQGAEYPMQYMLVNVNQLLFWAVFFLIPPLLTMRLFAEERNSGTLEMLMTAPLRDWQVVLAKFVACYGFYVLLWLPTLLYLPALLGLKNPEFRAAWTPYSIGLLVGLGLVLVAAVMAFLPGGNRLRLVALVLFLLGVGGTAVGAWGHYIKEVGPEQDHIFMVTTLIDPMPVVTTYLGVALAGAMLLSIGLLVSSLVRNQQVAALLSASAGSGVFLLTGFYQAHFDWGQFLTLAKSKWGGFFSDAPQRFSQDFCRGLIDTRNVVLYVSVTLCALFLTVRSLESRRWQ